MEVARLPCSPGPFPPYVNWPGLTTVVPCFSPRTEGVQVSGRYGTRWRLPFGPLSLVPCTVQESKNWVSCTPTGPSFPEEGYRRNRIRRCEEWDSLLGRVSRPRISSCVPWWVTKDRGFSLNKGPASSVLTRRGNKRSYHISLGCKRLPRSLLVEFYLSSSHSRLLVEFSSRKTPDLSTTALLPTPVQKL